MRSKLGKAAVAVRDAEDRTRFIGYKVEHVTPWVFTISAILVGIAGAPDQISYHLRRGGS